MTSSGKPATAWIIERVATGETLGAKTRKPNSEAVFGSGPPLMWYDFRDVKRFWLRHCVVQGYLVRCVTLPGERIRHRPGPDFRAMPQVRFARLGIQEVGFELPTLEDLGIET